MIVSGILLYFLPAIIGRHKRNAAAIFVLNLLAGWTVFGWIIALVWALTAETPNILVAPPQAWNCSACRVALRPIDRFCPLCGTPIAWPSRQA